MVSDTIARLRIFWLEMPLRRLFRVLRDRGRAIRISLGLRRPLPPKEAQEELPVVSIKNLCSPSGTRFREIEENDGNITPVELGVINAICATYKPEKIFEIGTFDGRTTLNMAVNTDAEIFTLDLPEGQETAFETVAEDIPYLKKPVSHIGRRFQSAAGDDLPSVNRITQLYGDSATFDYSPWLGAMGLVFVDGSHTYEYVINDTDAAFRLLRPEGGIILWHDYGEWIGVTKALNELRKKRPELELRHIRGTSLVVTMTGNKKGNLRPY